MISRASDLRVKSQQASKLYLKLAGMRNQVEQGIGHVGDTAAVRRPVHSNLKETKAIRKILLNNSV